ncbi:MAG: division/cell wall cluster transcriptional repressor MraZ [Pseudomonadota bacterium]
MELSFTGEHRHKVDGKGRVSIPSQFRRVLEGADPDWTEGLSPGVYLQYGASKQVHLECFTVTAWREVTAKIKAMPRGSQQRRTLEKLFSAKVIQTTVDDTGRLVLPAWVREKLGLSDQATFVATGDTFQVWSPENYAEVEAELEEELDALPDGMDPLEWLDAASGSGG